MSGPTLEGCIAKLKRADKNIHDLEAQVGEFVDEYAYTLRVDPRIYLERPPLEIEIPDEWRDSIPPGWERIGDHIRTIDPIVSEFLLRIRPTGNEPPIYDWGARIGEIIHDLRSALDHLVWQLTLANGHTPPAFPLPRGSCWRRVSFPITDADTDFGQVVRNRIVRSGAGVGCLWGVRPELLTEFKRLQPWFRRKHSDRADLWKLQELWNIDKHRTVIAVQSVGGYLTIADPKGGWRISGAREAFRTQIVWRKRLGPFKNDAPLARVRFIAGATSARSIQHYVDMHTLVSFGVAFEPGSPLGGADVLQALRRLKDTVAAILIKFEPEFR